MLAYFSSMLPHCRPLVSSPVRCILRQDSTNSDSKADFILLGRHFNFISLPYHIAALVLQIVSPFLLFQLEALRLRHLTLCYASDNHCQFIDDAFPVGRFSALKYLDFVSIDIIEPLTYLKVFKVFPSVTDVFWIGSPSSVGVLLVTFADAPYIDDLIDQ